MKTTYCKQFNVISIQHYENGRSKVNGFWHSFHSKRNALWNRTIFGWKVLSLVIFFLILNWSLICLMWWVHGLHYVHVLVHSTIWSLHICFEMLWNIFEMLLICFTLLHFAWICFNLLENASGKSFKKCTSKNVLRTQRFRIHDSKQKKPKYTNWNWKRSHWDRIKPNIKLSIVTSGQAWKKAVGLFLVSAKV